MGIGHQNAAVALGEATKQTMAIVDALAAQDHPQTAQANAVFQQLVGLEGQLFAVPQTQALKTFVPELEDLAHQCDGKLAPIKPFVDEALNIAREG